MAPPTSGVDATQHINSNSLKMLIKLLCRPHFLGNFCQKSIFWSFDSEKKPAVCSDEALFFEFLIEFRARSNCLNYAVLDLLNEDYTALKSILDTSFNAKTPTPSTWGAFAPFRNADRYHNLAQLNL